MARQFEIPVFYRSPIMSTVKIARRKSDHRKQDLSLSVLELGGVRIKIARHFGFCFGVENAIEIAYRALKENPDKRVFLLSEMIHNPHVNADLISRGIKFILDTDGTQLIPFEMLKPEDIVIVPAFGTTRELFEKLESLGINPKLYNATCPFVEKVWRRAEELGRQGFTIIIHGKHSHEETRATFSHARISAPSIIVRDLKEARTLAAYLRREKPISEFAADFEGRYSKGFDPNQALERIGVVNQTTMLASETQQISELLRDAMRDNFGTDGLSRHFADTRDTLCYATYENQAATHELIQSGGDLALVVGGYNSSNTSHLVELCEQQVETYYIKDADEIIDASSIRHLDLEKGEVKLTRDWLPNKRPLEILLTAGASCPDILVDQVISKISGFLGVEDELAGAIAPFERAAQELSITHNALNQ